MNTIIRKGAANHFIEEVGMKGHLRVTETEVFFETDKKNFRQYTLSIPLHTITEVSCKNNLHIFPHGIIIALKNGTTHRFAVWGRKKWVHTITEALKKAKIKD